MLLLAHPLQDVLGHPNTRVLVSHCGYHSVYEAMFHAVPVVGVPFQFEQVWFARWAFFAERFCCRGLGSHL